MSTREEDIPGVLSLIHTLFRPRLDPNSLGPSAPPPSTPPFGVSLPAGLPLQPDAAGVSLPALSEAMRREAPGLDLRAITAPQGVTTDDTRLVSNQPNVLERIANRVIAPIEYPERVKDPRYVLGQSVARIKGAEVDKASEDAWKLYLGLEQENDTFERSPYKPSEAKDSEAKYLRLKDAWSPIFQQYQGFDDSTVVRHFLRQIKQDGGRTQIAGDAVGLYALANFQISAGQDEKGPYIAMYDKWDLNQPLEGVVGEPFEIYDRLYYDPKTFKPIKDKDAP